MAKFVIAGRANCPYFARAELVADTLARNLPDFKVYKIIKSSSEWQEWLEKTCNQNNWKHKQSPIIWRELVNRGGRGMLLGGINDFLEYTSGYYGISTDLTSEDLRKISAENERNHELIVKELKLQSLSIKPLVITITNPESLVVPFIIPEMLNGNIFENVDDIEIRLFTANTERLKGLKMEIEDLASSKLRSLKLFKSEREAFTDCDYVILLDDLISDSDTTDGIYQNPYTSLAKNIDQFSKSSCKILISPFWSRSETYSLVETFSQHLERINRSRNVIGNSMSEEMIAKSLLSHRLKVNPAYVKDVILVGQSLQNAYYIDISKAKVTNFDGAVWARKGTHWLSLVNMVADKDWIHKDFIASVHERSTNNLISEKLKRDGLYTFSQSLLKILKLWNQSQSDDCLYSAIVNVNGCYGVNEDVYLSVPVKFENGSFEISDNYFQNNNNSLISEIAEETLKTKQKKAETYVKEVKEKKLTIPNVKIE